MKDFEVFEAPLKEKICSFFFRFWCNIFCNISFGLIDSQKYAIFIKITTRNTYYINRRKKNDELYMTKDGKNDLQRMVHVKKIFYFVILEFF